MKATRDTLLLFLIALLVCAPSARAEDGPVLVWGEKSSYVPAPMVVVLDPMQANVTREPSSCVVGGQVAFRVCVVGGVAPYRYEYRVYRRAFDATDAYFWPAGAWTSGAEPTFSFTPSLEGQYMLLLRVYDGTGSRFEHQDKVFDVFAESGADDESTVGGKVARIVAQYASGAMSDFDKALALHDWLTGNANYDYTDDPYYGPEGVLLHARGRCQSYALAYQMLCAQAGLECRYVSNADHAWNVVRMDGQWYHVDCTWDDPGAGGGERRAYFGLPDEVIAKDHAAWNGVVSCRAYACHYGYARGLFDAALEQTDAEIAEAIRAGERSLSAPPPASVRLSIDRHAFAFILSQRTHTVDGERYACEAVYNEASGALDIAVSGESALRVSKLDFFLEDVDGTDVPAFTAFCTVAGGTGAIRYAFEVTLDGEPTAFARDFLSENRYQFSPSLDGTYLVRVTARDAETEAVVAEASSYFSTLSLNSLTASAETGETGEAITWTAAASGGVGSRRYYFEALLDGVVAAHSDAYAESETFAYTPTRAGAYTARVYVRDSRSGYATLAGGGVTVTPGTLRVAGLTADAAEAKAGEPLTWTLEATGGSGRFAYYFDIYRNGERVAGSRTYGASSAFAFTPDAGGLYRARGFAKDLESGEKAYAYSDFARVDWAAASVARVVADETTSAVGEVITWAAEATGGSGKYAYHFTIYRDGVRVAGSASYGASAAYAYTPREAGAYTARAYVKDTMTGDKASRLSGATVVTEEPLSVAAVSADRAGDDLVFSIVAAGGSGEYAYHFTVYKDGVRVAGSASYGASPEYAYAPLEAGAYRARGFVKDTRTGAKASLYSETIAVETDALRVARVEAETMDGALVWTIRAAGGSGDYAYYFTIYKDGARVAGSRAYGASASYRYAASEPGEYRARGFVKDLATGVKVSLYSDVTVVKTDEVRVTRVEAETLDGAIEWTVEATGGSGRYAYYFQIFRDGVRVAGSAAYGESASYRYDASEPGEYRARGFAKDLSTGTKANAYSAVVAISE